MIIVIFAISLIATIILVNTDNEEAGIGTFMLSLVSLIVLIVLGVSVSKLRTIDDKIDLYNEQNNMITAHMEEAVYNYMGYESSTFEKLKNEDAMAIVQLYPELKSDELVLKELEVYNENVKNIMELKEEKIDGKIIKWWLYFGGSKE